MATQKKDKKKIESTEEMEAKVVELEREIFDLRNERAVQRKLDKPHLLKAKRHEKARLLTIITKNRRMGS